MKSGRVVQSFSVGDGRRVVLRTPRWEDVDDLLELINSLVDEGAEISRDERIPSRDAEVDWMSRVLAAVEKDEEFFLVAEVDRRVVASSSLDRLRAYEKHVGVIGIVIKNGFRDLGIGTRMMQALEEQARGMGLKVLTLSAFATNKRALHVYEKVGFVQTGRVPRKHFKGGSYIDEVIMAKVLE
jgi:RimJ/RimL family protein N-acetyltransferase